MDTMDFELSLKKDRNWLSKYGGFISLIIIFSLLIGIVWIKVPEYRDVNISKGIAIMEIKKNDFKIIAGDSIFMSNEVAKEQLFIIDSVKTTDTKKTLYFTKTNTLVPDGNFRLLVKERSLLKSLMSPFIKE